MHVGMATLWWEHIRCTTQHIRGLLKVSTDVMQSQSKHASIATHYSTDHRAVGAFAICCADSTFTAIITCTAISIVVSIGPIVTHMLLIRKVSQIQKVS